MDLRQTNNYAKFLRLIGWKIEIDSESKVKIYIRKLPATGVSVIKIQRPDELPLQETIRRIIKKYRAIQVNIETLDDNKLPYLTAQKYKRQAIPFLPSNTVLIDLKLTESQLLSQMKSKTRYNLRLSKKRGVRVKVFDGIELIKNKQLFNDLFEMQRQNAKRLGIFVLPKKWFIKQYHI